MSEFVVRLTVEEAAPVADCVELFADDEVENFRKIYIALGLSGTEVPNLSALDDHIFDVLSQAGPDLRLNLRVPWDDTWPLRGLVETLMSSQAFEQRQRALDVSIWIASRAD